MTLHDDLKFSNFETLCVYRSFISPDHRAFQRWLIYSRDTWHTILGMKDRSQVRMSNSEWARKLLAVQIRDEFISSNPLRNIHNIYSAFIGLCIAKTCWIELADALLRDIRNDCKGYVSIKFPLETDKLETDKLESNNDSEPDAIRDGSAQPGC